MEQNPYEAPLQARLVEKPPKRKRTLEEMNRRDAVIACFFAAVGLLLVFAGWHDGSIANEWVTWWAGGVLAICAVLFNISRH